MNEGGYGLCKGSYCPADPLQLDRDFDRILVCELGIHHPESHMIKVGPGLAFRWNDEFPGSWLQRIVDK